MSELLTKPKNKMQTGLYIDQGVYSQAAQLAEGQGTSTNQVLCDLVALGLKTLKAKGVRDDHE